MIKNIVFDMGNVIIRFDPAAFIDRYGVSAGDKQMLLTEIFRSPEWVMMDRGTLTDEQCADILCPRLPEHLREIARKLIALWDRPIIEVEGIYPLIEELKSKGKPEAVIEKIAPKIVEGRLNAFYKETVLLEQAYVKDPSKTVGDLFKEVGGNATAFARVEVGKGAEA